MNISTAGPHAVDQSDIRPLITFSLIGLPVGWMLLSIPLLTGLPLSPFILGATYLGLVLPAVVLTRRDRQASTRALFRDVVRLPRPVWLLLPATLLIPVGTAAVGGVLGVGTDLSPSFLGDLALVNVLSSLIIVNLWEELAWAGFVQRRATARWGYAGGSVVTALLFTGVHLPLTFYGASSVGAVGYNIAAMVVAGIGMRLLIGAFDRWGRGSILALGLIHATFNASSALIEPDSDWVRYVVTLTLGLAAFAVYARTGATRGRTPDGNSRSSGAERAVGTVLR
jgi:membrane protease YdiL (CAAX protease family)